MPEGDLNSISSHETSSVHSSQLSVPGVCYCTGVVSSYGEMRNVTYWTNRERSANSFQKRSAVEEAARSLWCRLCLKIRTVVTSGSLPLVTVYCSAMVTPSGSLITVGESNRQKSLGLNWVNCSPVSKTKRWIE